MSYIQHSVKSKDWSETMCRPMHSDCYYSERVDADSCLSAGLRKNNHELNHGSKYLLALEQCQPHILNRTANAATSGKTISGGIP